MIRFTDRVPVGEIKETREGYLIATARVARTGVQEYLASELGDVAINAGFKPTDIVRVYRAPDQVFADSALTSITRVPVTLDHPPEPVTAETWGKYAVGEVGDSYARDGEWIVVNPMIKDAAAIRAAQTTHREISMGYEAEIIPARDGVPADFEQVNIRQNHLALVRAARAGDMARIGDAWGVAPVNDSQPGGKPTTVKGGRMSDQLKTVVLGDKAVQVAVTDVAAIEQYKADSKKALADANKALADAKAEHVKAITAKDEEIGTLRAELETAKKAADVDVDALAEERAELVGVVKSIDSGIETKGKSAADLRRAAVAAKLGDELAKDASDAEITGMFRVIAKDASSVNPVGEVINKGVKPTGMQTNDAHADYIARLTRQIKGA